MKSNTPASSVRDLLVERLDALLSECDLVMDTAAYGQTLNDLDQFLFDAGRKFTKEVFQQKLQERIQHVEQQTESKKCPNCKKKTQYQNKKSKTLTGTLGSITLERLRRCCDPCEHSFFPVDAILGLNTSYTTALTRVVTRCCGHWSYRHAADILQELCGIRLSHTTIGKIADQTAVKLTAKMQDNSALRETFQKAKGAIEFYADGVFVPILNDEGKIEWREMKVGAFAKRESGPFALPSEWYTRHLPEPTVVAAFAAIVDKEGFQELCQSMRRCFGVGGVSSALGDGAKWIWNVVREVFGKTDECLDIFHGAEHISDCGKALFDESASKEWFERMRLVLLSEGFAGMERELLLLRGTLTEKQQASVDLLLEYLRGNAGRLNYAERLSVGRAIGSGLIEGACKNLVGRRLKQTGAPWRLQRANRMATICALLYSDQWKLCW